MIAQLVLSIFLGLIPEVLYFTLFITYCKNIKEKRIRLFLFISLAYVLCMFIQKYKIFYYVLFIALIYWIMKIVYKEKTQIIDVFVISISLIYITLISYFCFNFLNDDLSNYYLLMFIARVILYLPFLFKKYFNIIYKKYCKLWNRNAEEIRPIKSITLRNISLITINIAIFFMNLYAISVINFIE